MFLLRILVVALIPANVFGETGKRDATVLLEVDVLNLDGQANASVHFTLDDLRAMPAVSFETGTFRYSGPQHFKGLSLVEHMGQMGVTDGTLMALGRDRSFIFDHKSLTTKSETIIAYERIGSIISVRSNGSLQVVYPFDKYPPLRKDVLFFNAVSQLIRIVVKPER